MTKPKPNLQPYSAKASSVPSEESMKKAEELWFSFGASKTQAETIVFIARALDERYEAGKHEALDGHVCIYGLAE